MLKGILETPGWRKLTVTVVAIVVYALRDTLSIDDLTLGYIRDTAIAGLTAIGLHDVSKAIKGQPKPPKK
jgi:hypothetical protein